MQKATQKYRLKFMQDGFVVRMTVLAPNFKQALKLFENEGLHWKGASITRVK